MSENPTAAVAAARLATRDDLPSLEANETDKTRGLSATYLDEQERGDFYVVVGLLDGEVVGRVVLDVRDDPSVLAPEMKLLWVVPSARRKGLGAVMTHELEALARSLGYDEIFLGVSADNNPAAQRTGDRYEFIGHKRDTPGGTQYVVRRSGFAKPTTLHHSCHVEIIKDTP